MTGTVATVATAITVLLTVYYLVYNVLFGALVTRAAFAVAAEVAWPDDLTHELTFSNPLAPGVSVLVPAHNEQAGIVESVTSLLELRYPRVEIIVVDDGSTDRTVALLDEHFGLQPAEIPITSPITQEGPTTATFRSVDHPELIVISKASVGRRSDAVNAAFRRATQPLVCMIDADSILEPDALLHVVQPLIDDPLVVAAGGVVLPSNGARVERGRLTSITVPSTWTERTQVLEYLRAFLVGRSGWSAVNGLMIISGAFGLFRRDVMAEVGGLDETSLAEDADLVVAVHRLFRDRKEPYKVVFVPEPVCWTEVPSTLTILANQRKRWSQGLGELLGKHRSMLGRPRYGALGLVTMPYFLAFELLGPVAELVGVVVSVVGVLTGWVPLPVFTAYFTVSVLLSVGVSLAALLVEESSFARYPRARDSAVLALTALLEPLWYRYLHSWWRIVGLWRALRRTRSGWGEMTRTGFAPGAADQPSDG